RSLRRRRGARGSARRWRSPAPSRRVERHDHENGKSDAASMAVAARGLGYTAARMSDTTSLAERLRSAIRDVPDFPREGVLFKDIGTLLGDGAAFHAAIDGLVDAYRDEQIDKVAGVESRGF